MPNLLFADPDEYVDCGSDSSIDDLWSGGATALAWINVTDGGGNNVGRIMDKRGTGSGWSWHVHGPTSGGLMRLRFIANFSSLADWNTGYVFPVSEWVLVGVSWDSDSNSNDPTFWVQDDEEILREVSLSDDNNQSGSYAGDGSKSLYIGNRPDTTNRGFEGKIAACWLFDKIIDADDFRDPQALLSGNLIDSWAMEEGSGSDVASNSTNNDGTITGASWETLDRIQVLNQRAHQVQQMAMATNNRSIRTVGLCSGYGSEDIEQQFDGGGYADLDTAPAQDMFAGSITYSKGQGDLITRFKTTTSVTQTLTDWGVGITILAAGQSNLIRLASNQTAASSSFTMKMFQRDSNAWETMADPIVPTEDGSYIVLVAELLSDIYSCPVGVVIDAEGSTGLISSGDASHEWQQGDARYNNFMRTVKNAMILDPLCMIWDQGEADVAGAVAQATYAAGLNTLHTDLKSDTLRTFPMCVVQIGSVTSGSASDLDAIQLAGQDADGTYSDIHLIATRYDQTPTDGVHLTTNAQGWEMAMRVAVGIRSKVVDEDDDDLPFVVSCIENGDRDEITVTFSKSLETGLAYDTDPWSVTDTASPSVTAVADHVSDDTKIVLTLSTALTGSSPTLSLGAGEDGDGHVVPAAANVSVPEQGTGGGTDTVNPPAFKFVDFAVTEESTGNLTLLGVG